MKKLLLLLLYLWAPLACAGFDPAESVIDPIEFEHNATQYAVGAWINPFSGTPFFNIVRYENGQWLSFGGKSNELSKSRVTAFGGEEAYIKHHIDQWNTLLVPVSSEYTDGFEQYMHAHLFFNGEELEFMQ